MIRDKSKVREKSGFVEFLTVKTSLPSDALAGNFRLEMRGRNSLMIFGCKKILEYFPKRISVETKDFQITVIGERLICTTFHQGTVCIEGFVCGIEMPCTNEGEEK